MHPPSHPQRCLAKNPASCVYLSKKHPLSQLPTFPQKKNEKKRRVKSSEKKNSPPLILPQIRHIRQIRPRTHPPMMHTFILDHHIPLTPLFQSPSIRLLQFRRAVFLRKEADERDTQILRILFRQRPVISSQSIRKHP